MKLEEIRKQIESSKEPKDVNKLKVNRKFITKIKDFFKDKYFPDKTVLVNMELTNGMHKSWLVIEKNRGFKYKNGLYILDEESKYFNIDAKLWSYDFHENFSLPVRRKIPVTDIKKTLESVDISEVEYATNPMTLERFVISRVAEGIMKGQQLDEFMRKLMLIMIITMLGTLIHFILFIFASGMLKNIKLPF